MVEALIFTGGMLVGGAVATVVLCCVMINGCWNKSADLELPKKKQIINKKFKGINRLYNG